MRVDPARGFGYFGPVVWLTFILLIAVAVGLYLRLERLRAKFYALQKNLKSVEGASIASVRALRQWLLVEDLRRQGREPRLRPEFMAGDGEDLALWPLFEGQEKGTFIECGAYDGVRFSVTYVFEAVGWGGVLIEALPNVFEECRKNRPGSRVVHAAVSKRGSSGTAEFLAFSSDTINDAMSRLAESSGTNNKSTRKTTSISVPLTTMDAVLGEPTAPIDLAVLDVEGGELDLLDGFDLERYKVRVLLIEELSAGEDKRLRRLMDGRGYEYIARVGRNDLYITRREPELIRRAKQLTTLV